MKRFVFVLLILPFLPGCVTQANQADEARKIVQQVHQAFKEQNWDAILPLYDKSFFQARSKEQWLKELKQMTASLGELKSIQSTFQQKDPRFSGEFYIFGSLLQYERGSIRETITIFHRIDGDKMAITGHLLKPRKHGAST